MQRSTDNWEDHFVLRKTFHSAARLTGEAFARMQASSASWSSELCLDALSVCTLAAWEVGCGNDCQLKGFLHSSDLVRYVDRCKGGWVAWSIHPPSIDSLLCLRSARVGDKSLSGAIAGKSAETFLVAARNYAGIQSWRLKLSTPPKKVACLYSCGICCVMRHTVRGEYLSFPGKFCRSWNAHHIMVWLPRYKSSCRQM